MTIEKLFARNENGLDRTLRVLIGLVLLALVFVGPKSSWGLLGVVPLATGLLGSCPLYTLFGIRTCSAPGTKGAGVSPRGAHL